MTDQAEINQEPVITAALVENERERSTFIPRKVGLNHWLAFETSVFNWLTKNSDGTYDGGYWDFYKLDNGGFFMSPAGEKKFTVETPNGTFENLTGQAAGIIACMFVLCGMANTWEQDQHIKAYHDLRLYIGDTEESAAIYQAIN